MPGVIVYGWDLTKDESLQIELKNNDGSSDFENKLNDIIESLESEYHPYILHEKYNEEYHHAFGIILDKFDYGNVLLSNIVMNPTKQQKEMLKNSVAQLDDESRKFFKKAGKPQAFILICH